MNLYKAESEYLNLKAVGICKSYKDVDVVKNFSVEIHSGEVVGLVGDNGVGKSTIMRIVALVDGLDLGTIHINGKNAYEYIKHFRSQIGYIPQSNALIDEMSAFDNLMLFSLNDKKQTIRKIEELTEAFQMDEFISKKIKHLSGGMTRRVNIAAGLINSPKLIIADEPFAGLDATQREKVIDYFKVQSKNGVGQLISSHYKENLSTWSNSIITLKKD